ncbi:MAG: hypothetical protein ABI572_05950 [Actinomycetota bacterium]
MPAGRGTQVTASTGRGVANYVSGETLNNGASGVHGKNEGTDFGVGGRATKGTSVLADSSNATALDVRGTAKFSRSGVVTIAYP